MDSIQVNQMSVKGNCQGHNKQTYRVCTIRQLFTGDAITYAFNQAELMQ